MSRRTPAGTPGTGGGFFSTRRLLMLAASGPAAGSGFVGSYMDMGVSGKLGGGGRVPHIGVILTMIYLAHYIRVPFLRKLSQEQSRANTTDPTIWAFFLNSPHSLKPSFLWQVAAPLSPSKARPGTQRNRNGAKNGFNRGWPGAPKGFASWVGPSRSCLALMAFC